MENRRGHNEGTIYERKGKDGRVFGYQAQISLPDGKRKSFSGKTKKEVRAKLDEARAALSQGRLATGRSQKVGDYLQAWLETKRPSIRPRTCDSYALNVRRAIPHLGTVRLDSVKATHMQDCYNALYGASLSARTVQHVHRVLHRAFEDAIKLDLIVRNPTDGATPPRVESKEMKTLTANQLSTLFEATRGDRFSTLWILLGTTGLRIGEAMGLKWEDINLPKRTLAVRRALQRQRGGAGLRFVEPKSTSSRRIIELSDLACTALKEHRERQAFERKAAEMCWEENDLIFSTVFGTPMAPEHIKAFLDKALDKAGLPHVRIHDMRHTAATVMLHELGLPVKLVSEMLGHSSVTITLTTYGHVIPGMHREAADRIGSLFASTTAAGTDLAL